MAPKKNIVLMISLLLSVLIIIVSGTAILTPGFYNKETINWQVQSAGQDMIDLFFIVPCLLIAAALYYNGRQWAVSIWAGIMLYLAYTFVIYCFNIHFNKLFVLYCLSLGLSFYGLVYLMIMRSVKDIIFHLPKTNLIRYTAIYFFLISVTFYFTWLAEIIPANMENKIPQSLTDTGLFTNGVHVLDLSFLLPGIVITGILILKGSAPGYIMAPILLTFFILMDITIAVLSMLMKWKAVGGNSNIAIIMMILSIASLVFLVLFFRHTGKIFKE